MALNFFKQRDIDEMDVNDIPEDFVNYLETIDEDSKIALLESRPDIAEKLGISRRIDSAANIEDKTDSELETADIAVETTGMSAYQEYAEEESEKESEESEEISEEEDDEEYLAIQKNYYEHKDIANTIRNNLQPLEALTIPNDSKRCMIHRRDYISKQIKYTGNGVTYGLVLKTCPQCNRLFLEESSTGYVHAALMKRNVEHTFYSLEASSRYLRSQITEYEISSDRKIYIPETWTEDNPLCPIHKEALFKIPCVKRHKGRKVEFSGYLCDKCNKILLRSADAAELEDQCALKGVPEIETEPLIQQVPKKPVVLREIKPDYFIENGKRVEYTYKKSADCFKLTESDTVVVSDSIYCTLEGHDTDIKEVLALIWIKQKRGGRKAYLFMVGYCAQCQKYYMDIDDFKVVYPLGRLEVTIVNDVNDEDYQITSGEVFNLENDHLNKLESQIKGEIDAIHNSDDYVSPYAVGDYDDGGRSFAKSMSARKYGPRLDELSNYIDKPYSYRVDITADGDSETYYIGAADVILDDGKKVISANSSLGHELINYQTIKVHKDGKDFDIKLSRQFDIKNATLFGYLNLRTDEDVIFKSGITDPFLVRVLNMRKKQHNLTDIFVTIQENQNRIVNVDFAKNIIVQGCAGSGKTMVLLHRLSALKYKRQHFDFSKNALILTPNDEFTLHIKGLAEELQIGSVPRLSVEQYYLELLLQCDAQFKPENKIVSEMAVRQDFVDYIYSDQFKKDFAEAYDKVLKKRNDLAEMIIRLSEDMGSPYGNISEEDENKFYLQMRYRADHISGLLRAKEQELSDAQDELTKITGRKSFLEAQVPKSEKFREETLKEVLPRVNTKIAQYLLEKQKEIDELDAQLQGLRDEYDSIGNSLFVWGKRGRLEKIDANIKELEEKKNSLLRQLDSDKELLVTTRPDDSDEKIIDWMRQSVSLVKPVREEVRLYNNAEEEYTSFLNEFEEIDEKIDDANQRYGSIQNEQYPADVRKAVQYINEQLQTYSVLEIYRQIFDEAVYQFKTENNVGNILGKVHRYDLYAQLMFARKYFRSELDSIQYMCVDEGQDLALNEYRLIYELNRKKVVFNIFGDTNQLMKPGRGIADWDSVTQEFQAEKYMLNENYRNTNQITRFCNDNFGLDALQTGVDGPKVREILRRDLEKELVGLNIASQRIALLLPRSVQKKKYLDMELLPANIKNVIGDTMDNGFISVMYVDEVKGIEFDKVYVVSSRMARNEKYIAYTRALTELVVVVDDSIPDYDDGSRKKKTAPKTAGKKDGQKKTSGALRWNGKKKASDIEKKMPNAQPLRDSSTEPAVTEKKNMLQKDEDTQAVPAQPLQLSEQLMQKQLGQPETIKEENTEVIEEEIPLTEETSMDPEKETGLGKSAVRDFFEEHGLEVVDERADGGRLWVFGEKSEIRPVINMAIAKFAIAGKYKSSNAWYTKTKQ